MSSISFNYLFDAYPPLITRGMFLFLLIFSLILISASFTFKYLVNQKKPILNSKFDKYEKIFCQQLMNLFLTGGLINILLLFFRKVRIPYFQMRFLMFAWWGIIFIWLANIIQHYLTKVPESREFDAKQRKYEKYIK